MPRSNVVRAIVIAVVLLGTRSTIALGAERASKTIDFARDVYPVLKRSCFECHGPQRVEGGLRLDRREDALRGGDSGPIFEAGHAEHSELVRRVVLPKEDDEIMPARGAPLTATETRILRDWINQGANWPAIVRESQHWAYVKPVRGTLPEVKNSSWCRNDIDRFVLARLEAEGMKPSPAADRAILLRRVTLDLTGLPPTPQELDQFLADTSPQAYERAVDRLLARSEFGERWARPWLDAARYADSHGFQRDDLRSLWPYRDWVINALNADMPFDQFTIEQLAGDLLPGATEAQKIATGFNRCAPTNCEAGSDPEETRVNQVIDRVNTTAAVWLGATLECAQCHDHKYDPFTQRDYYGLFAYFNNTALEADRSNIQVPGSIRFIGPAMTLADPRRDAERTELNAALAQLDKRLAERRAELAKDLPAWESELRPSIGGDAEVYPLEVADFDSAADAHRVLDDHSVLLVDDAPEKDTYVVTVRSKLPGITGFKLEALTDPSLPGNGPGRGDADRPNFVLNTFSATIADAKDGVARPIVLRNAKADYSQKNYDAAGAIDNDPKTAWAIGGKFHQPHWATFETTTPVGSADGAVFTFTLVQEFGGGRTIGRLRLSAMTGDLRTQQLPAEIVGIIRKPAERRSPQQTKQLLDYCVGQDEMARSCQAERSKIALKVLANSRETTLVMQEMPQGRPTKVFMRGDFRTPGADVVAATPAVLTSGVLKSAVLKSNMKTAGNDRLALARWLVDSSNPLTARVTVNRWWAELFGQGIVSTVEDFGIKGELPTHPELLDWLATEFMEQGWSTKRMLKTIVLSAAYCQSSRLSPELLAKDDRNLLLARGPRFRMDAEMIRDNALSIAGLLSHERGGPSIRPYQPDGLWVKVGGAKVEYVVSPGEARYRRGVYVVWKRGAPYPSFINFDASARLACKLKRSRSNTPLQALTLLNDPVYVEAAKALARRVISERGQASADEQLEYAFRLCLARAPRPTELARLRQLLTAQRLASRQEVSVARELASGFVLPKGVTAIEFAAWYAVAQTLLNLDETITKG